MSETAAIREATAADAEAISRIWAEVIAERVATFETNPPAPQAVRELLATGRPALVAVADDGEVLAFAKIGPYSDPAHFYRGVGEATLYVTQGARRGGIAGRLLDALAVEAEAAGYWKLVGKIFASTRPASPSCARAAGDTWVFTCDMAGWTANGRT